jgi:hypothetical protein
VAQGMTDNFMNNTFYLHICVTLSENTQSFIAAVGIVV